MSCNCYYPGGKRAWLYKNKNIGARHNFSNVSLYSLTNQLCTLNLCKKFTKDIYWPKLKALCYNLVFPPPSYTTFALLYLARNTKHFYYLQDSIRTKRIKNIRKWGLMGDFFCNFYGNANNNDQLAAST